MSEHAAQVGILVATKGAVEEHPRRLPGRALAIARQADDMKRLQPVDQVTGPIEVVEKDIVVHEHQDRRVRGGFLDGLVVDRRQRRRIVGEQPQLDVLAARKRSIVRQRSTER